MPIPRSGYAGALFWSLNKDYDFRAALPEYEEYFFCDESEKEYGYADLTLDNVCTYSDNWCTWANVPGKAIVYGEMSLELDVPYCCTELSVTVHVCCNGYGEGLSGPDGSSAQILVGDDIREESIDASMNYHHGMYYRYESCQQFTQTFDVAGKQHIHLAVRMIGGAKLDFDHLTTKFGAGTGKN